MLFDKTGTLTRGTHVVTGVAVAGDAGLSDDDAARARRRRRGRQRAPAGAWRSWPRRSAPWSGARRPPTSARSPGGASKPPSTARCVAVGGPALLRERGLVEPRRSRARAIDDWRARGAVDPLRRAGDARSSARSRSKTRSAPSRAAAIDALHRRGVRVVMITGDAQQVADSVAAQVGVDEVFAEVLPEDKDTHGRGAAVAWPACGDGRRRRERRARARARRRRPRDRRRHRRRDRVGRGGARVVRPAGVDSA